MKPRDVSYRKLPGAAWTASGHTGLWLAEDHLLEASALFIFERYHRFFLRDIRALLVQQTKVGGVLNMIFGLVGLVGLIATAAFGWGVWTTTELDARIGLWIFTALFGLGTLLMLALLVANLLLGPTCRCVIHTAAGAHFLEAPRRLRRAHRLLAELVPRIEAAQATAPAFAATAP